MTSQQMKTYAKPRAIDTNGEDRMQDGIPTSWYAILHVRTLGGAGRRGMGRASGAKCRSQLP